jgi:hypothetical protein
MNRQTLSHASSPRLQLGSDTRAEPRVPAAFAPAFTPGYIGASFQGATTAGGANGAARSDGSDGSSASATGSKSATRRLQRFLRRLLRPSSLDFETAIWEIFHLVVHPHKMFRAHAYRLQGQASYARDDPAFLVLLTGFLALSAVAWGLAYSPSVWDICKLVVYMVVVDFYLIGVVVLSVGYFVTNKWLTGPESGAGVLGSAPHHVDWAFCFDTHCNAFVTVWVLLYVVQFLLLPLINVERSFVALFLGNTLYFAALGYYFVIAFYGYNCLPFLSGGAAAARLQRAILGGVLPLLAVAWVVSLALGLNVARTMVATYFS